jgi:hypothetical protein
MKNVIPIVGLIIVGSLMFVATFSAGKDYAYDKVFSNIRRLQDSASYNLPNPYLPDSLYKIDRNRFDSFLKVSSYLIDLRKELTRECVKN